MRGRPAALWITLAAMIGAVATYPTCDDRVWDAIYPRTSQQLHPPYPDEVREALERLAAEGETPTTGPTTGGTTRPTRSPGRLDP